MRSFHVSPAFKRAQVITTHMTISLLVLMPLISGCGGEVYEEHNKKFYFYITESNFNPVFESLIQSELEYLNQQTELKRFHLTRDSGKANSFINLTSVSKQFGQSSIGAGGPLYRITTKPKGLNLSGFTETQKINHGMDIDIDRRWLVRNLNHLSYGQNQISLQHLPKSFRQSFRVLLFHEIGHGLNFPHSKNRHSVMFESISNRKNIKKFIKRVRSSLLENSY